MRDWLKRADEWANAHRPFALLATVAATTALVAAINWATGSDVFRQLFEPQPCPRDVVTGCDPLAWKDLFQAAILVLGLPIAFLLWHWRDVNVRDQIAAQREQVENARKDINLKEFQEVQLRAAGALDEKLPEEARQQLQIAALHQLRGFLRGDYGESFKRPAFELLLAGHAAAIYRIGVPQVQAQFESKKLLEIRQIVAALRTNLSPIDHTRMLIIRDEAKHIFRAEYPLDGRRFDLLDLEAKSLADGKNYRNSHFFNAKLISANLEGAKLSGVRFEGAILNRAHLKDADLFDANLNQADLHSANLEGAYLIGAYLEGATLRDAHFNGANLVDADLGGANVRSAHLEGANLRYFNTSEETQLDSAKFNSDTKFDHASGKDWDDLTEAEREEARAPWIARGMINVDARPSSETPSSRA